MANKSIGTATAVASMLKENSIFIEVGGSLRRITLENFMSMLNTDQEELLESVAWGIPLKYSVQSSPAWGMVGNTTMFNTYKGMTGRYALTSTAAGIATAAKCHPGDSTTLVDGTAVATDGTQSVMVIAPRLYYLVRSGDSYPTLWMSPYPISNHYLATTADGQYICLGAYKGSVVDGKLVSIHGNKFGQDRSISSFWSCAQTWNTGAGVMDYDALRWFQMMCLSAAGGNANAQATLGYGPGGSAAIAWDTFNASSVLTLTGKTSSLGDETGTVEISTDDGGVANSCHVSVLGIEDFWNCQWEMIQGIYFGSSSNDAQDGSEVYIYKGNRMPSSTELTTNPTGSYRQITRYDGEGWCKSIYGGEYFDTICSAVGGSSSSYFCDYWWRNFAGGQLCLAGAHSDRGTNAGPFFVNSSFGFGRSWSGFGARPAFYGNLRFAK